jgi:hypothetical protein
MVFREHPFSPLSREDVRKVLIKSGRDKTVKFPKLIEELKSILRNSDPLGTIAILTTYGITGTISHDGAMTSGFKGESFNQSHVELVQAVCLQIPKVDFSSTPTSPDAIQQLFDLLPELSHAFSAKRLIELEKQRSKEDQAILSIQEALRLHTQMVRNWGFLGSVRDLIKRLCAPIDDLFVRTAGFSASNLIDIFTHLLQRNESFLNNRIENLSTVLTKTSVIEMVDAYYEANPHFNDKKEGMVAFAAENKISLEQMKFIVLSHSDQSLYDAYIFDANTLATETEIDKASIASALNFLSLGIGDLQDKETEHLFLDNPVWTKPLIKLGVDQYFCAMPQAFFSFIFPILTSILEKKETALRKYQDRRSEFLESEIRTLFEKVFPYCEVAAGYKWQLDNSGYENDLLVRVDSHLIIVEAKSHSISWEALRGAPKRARRHVNEILLDPSLQSLRLANRVNECISNRDAIDSLLPNCPISLNLVETVLRLSVTLEDFATLQTTLHHARDAGWIPPNHRIAPCMLISDLAIVFDILESTPHKIHYLKRRADLESHSNYNGDELDLLGLYLKTGFNLGESEYDTTFTLLGMSSSIDSYYNSLEHGIRRKKPVPKITQWWSDICLKIEDRDFHQWSDAANILLNVSYEDQETLKAKFKQVTKNVRENWRLHNHNCAVAMIPHKKRTDAIAIMAFKQHDFDKRYKRMENVAASTFESFHVERCLVIAINIDEKHYPYSLISVFNKKAPLSDL